MAKKANQEAPIRMLPLCTKEAENLDIILACDGAASVGQVGHQVAVELTNTNKAARMCCITAVAAESKVHLDIARRAHRQEDCQGGAEITVLCSKIAPVPLKNGTRSPDFSRSRRGRDC